jgi:hypothetical protein
VLLVEVGALLDEQLETGLVAALGGEMERGAALVVATRHRLAALDRALHCRRVAGGCGSQELRHARGKNGLIHEH